MVIAPCAKAAQCSMVSCSGIHKVLMLEREGGRGESVCSPSCGDSVVVIGLSFHAIHVWLDGCTHDEAYRLAGCQESLIDCQSHVGEQLAVIVTGACWVIIKRDSFVWRMTSSTVMGMGRSRLSIVRSPSFDC